VRIAASLVTADMIKQKTVVGAYITRSVHVTSNTGQDTAILSGVFAAGLGAEGLPGHAGFYKSVATPPMTQ